MIKFIIVLVFSFALLNTACGQTSILEKFVEPFRVARKLFSNQLDAVLTSRHNQDLLKSNNKHQPLFKSREFPCNLYKTRSETRPNSVHKLRPGDIDVIGALGDSLTSGYGTFANSVPQIFLESRGASLITGGDEDWRTYLTIANILKVFNPNLTGYSTGNTLTIDSRSRFNVAEGGAISDNLPYMSRVLVKRIKSDSKVDLKDDWKFINIMMGSNDFCSEICYYKSPEKLLRKHENELIDVLRFLRDNLPRTLVNIVPGVDPMVLKLIKRKPDTCVITHKFFCPCLYGVLPESKLQDYRRVIWEWQSFDLKIMNMKEFQKEDFAVVVQPFTINMTLPRINNDVDLTYLSADCFHLSQKGYALLATTIWNSLLTPVGEKNNIININYLDDFKCPTQDRPYILTNQNSN